jgi:hypothetical protein
MPALVAGLLALYLILAAIKQFGRLKPADAARLARRGGAAIGWLGVLLMLLRGRIGLAGALASILLGGAASLRGGHPFANAFRSAGFGPKAARMSTARSATIEMRLDLDTGAIEGSVLAGPFQGRKLASLDRPECLRLREICRRDDPEGERLLEIYFDRRFAGWREADQSQTQGRSGRAGAGAMSRDEAYEVLGLAKDAGAEEIIRAHRALMKKLHPDHGGSTALAARVNQAKDVLLNRHV